MLLIISPSKTQNIDGPFIKDHTFPVFLSEIKTLIKMLKGFDRNGLASLMGLSEKLADSTWLRYQDFSSSFNSENSRSALLAFQGDVFTGIKALDFSSEDFQFAQNHLRIISGLYGLLRPLDLIQPYRLEMNTKLTTTSINNLYGFWDKKITELLNQDMKKTGSYLVNLASQEYFKAVKPAFLTKPVLDIAFKVKKNDQYKVIGIHAKRARGLMVNFVIKNRLVDINDLKKFKEEGYVYNESLSSKKQWIFCKD